MNTLRNFLDFLFPRKTQWTAEEWQAQVELREIRNANKTREKATQFSTNYPSLSHRR